MISLSFDEPFVNPLVVFEIAKTQVICIFCKRKSFEYEPYVNPLMD